MADGCALLFTAIDVIDAVFDYIFAGELRSAGFGDEAAWIAVQATLALAVELLIKLPLARTKNRDAFVKGVMLDALDTEEDFGQTLFILSASLIEMSIFLLEDTTTLLIWWRTGTYASSGTSLANMIFTVFSGVVALLGVGMALFRMRNLENQVTTPSTGHRGYQDAKAASIVLLRHRWHLVAGGVISAVLIVFWSYLALGEVIDGQSDVDDARLGDVATVFYGIGYIIALLSLYPPAVLAFRLYSTDNIDVAYHGPSDAERNELGGWLPGMPWSGDGNSVGRT